MERVRRSLEVRLVPCSAPPPPFTQKYSFITFIVIPEKRLSIGFSGTVYQLIRTLVRPGEAVFPYCVVVRTGPLPFNFSLCESSRALEKRSPLTALWLPPVYVLSTSAYSNLGAFWRGGHPLQRCDLAPIYALSTSAYSNLRAFWRGGHPPQRCGSPPVYALSTSAYSNLCVFWRGDHPLRRCGSLQSTSFRLRLIRIFTRAGETVTPYSVVASSGLRPFDSSLCEPPRVLEEAVTPYCVVTCPA